MNKIKEKTASGLKKIIRPEESVTISNKIETSKSVKKKSKLSDSYTQEEKAALESILSSSE